MRICVTVSALPLMGALCLGQTGSANRPPQPNGNSARALTVSDVLELVRSRNPDLLVARQEEAARDGAVLQASLPPNPEISAELEDVALFGPTSPTGVVETTLAASQRFEMRNRRGKRVDLARREQRVAALEARFLENEVLSAAARAFVDALTAQQRVQNSSELTRLAEETHRVVSERIAAGRVSPIEGTRSTVVLESARLEEARARRELRSARVRLASFWGGAASDVDAVEGTFEPPPPAPPEAPTAVDHPEIALTTAEIEARDADLVLQKAASAPDLTVSGGVRYLREYGAVAVLGGVSIELPVSDRNQGAVAAAAARVRQATLRRTAVEKRIDAELEQARIALETCRAEAGKLMELALPSAKDALAGLEEGYRQGKFDYLSVLDAQRTYIEIRARHIAAIAEALGAAVELEKLSGRAGKSGAFAFLQPGRGGLNAGEK